MLGRLGRLRADTPRRWGSLTPEAMLCHLARKSSSRQDLNTLQALEQQAIRQALQATGGDRVRAAKLLGIGKTTIYRKLKEYGIDVSSAEA